MEDLDKKAWEVFRRALDCVNFPSYVTVNKNEDGSFSFLLNLFNKDSGSGFFYYKPSIEIIKRMLTTFSEKKNGSLPETFYKEFAPMQAAAIAELWLKNFHLDLAESFLDLPEIPLLSMSMMMQETLDECDKQLGRPKQDWKTDSREYVKKLIAKKTRRIEARVYSEGRRFLQMKAPKKHLIAYFYPGLHKKWKEAKDCYERNKKFNNWQKMVVAAFDELPVELIERLGDPDTYNASPSAIALEHAALICGIDVQSVGLRTLQNYLKESRDWIEQVGEEKAGDEAKKYLDHTLEQLAATYHVAYLTGETVPKRELTFFEKELLTDNLEDTLIRAIKKFEEEESNSENTEEM
jgi:hypothetical protein